MKVFVIALLCLAICGHTFAKSKTKEAPPPPEDDEAEAEPKPEGEEPEKEPEEPAGADEEPPPLKPVHCTILSTPVCYIGCIKQRGNPTCCKTKGLMDINCECLRTIFIGRMPSGPSQFFKLMQTQFKCDVQNVVEGFRGLFRKKTPPEDAEAENEEPEPEPETKDIPKPKPKAKAKA